MNARRYYQFFWVAERFFFEKKGAHGGQHPHKKIFFNFYLHRGKNSCKMISIGSRKIYKIGKPNTIHHKGAKL